MIVKAAKVFKKSTRRKWFLDFNENGEQRVKWGKNSELQAI